MSFEIESLREQLADNTLKFNATLEALQRDHQAHVEHMQFFFFSKKKITLNSSMQIDDLTDSLRETESLAEQRAHLLQAREQEMQELSQGLQDVSQACEESNAKLEVALDTLQLRSEHVDTLTVQYEEACAKLQDATAQNGFSFFFFCFVYLLHFLCMDVWLIQCKQSSCRQAWLVLAPKPTIFARPSPHT